MFTQRYSEVAARRDAVQMWVTRRGECINVRSTFVTLPILRERPSAGNVATNGSSVFEKCPSINAGAAEYGARANFKVYLCTRCRKCARVMCQQPSRSALVREKDDHY